MVGKNIAVTANNYNSGQNPDFVDHCGRPIRYDSRIAGIKNGIPRVSVISRGRGRATIVKANEGRQDARCGRCLQQAA